MSNSKRVFITGTSAGFGFDTAKALAAKGHTVYATMRAVGGKNADKAAALARWAEDGGHPLHVLELDVTDEASIATAVATAVERGGIDVLINNAGIGTWGIDEGYSIDQARQVFDVNVLGMMRMNRAVIPHLRAAGKGLVIYLSSGLGRIVFPFIAIYTASKFAIEGYAESMSYELAPLGIESVIVQPGTYGTDFFANWVLPKTDVTGAYGATAQLYEAIGNGFKERLESGGVGDPAEVVEILVEEVERPAGGRPLRRAVGQDTKEQVSAINDACDQVQDQLLGPLGLR
ncbi:SDR family oxidoreductase [Haliangium sp.]|uniref:SDR family oxidoreductase n=1 Tax=Haliangium sp. TaxID=2663208 RepID=UPI003D1108A3